MANSHSHSAQVPEASAQPHLFGTQAGPPSPVMRALYGNGNGNGAGAHEGAGLLHRRNDSLLELDKALNYEVRVVAGNSNIPCVCLRRSALRRAAPATLEAAC
jgi:hypothetical protein